MESEFPARSFPEVVYANDGTKYYPCKYCCRAFAHKRYLTLHMRACLKKLDAIADAKMIDLIGNAKVSRRPKAEVKAEAETIDLTDEIKLSDSKPRRMKLNNNKVPQGNKQVGRAQTRKRAIEKCKICTMVFSSMEELIMHAKIEHNQRRNCEKRIFPPAELEYFYTIFLKSNRTTCPICDKPIGNKLNWKRHLYTHSSVKKYECLICKKTFSRSDHCKYHEKRHKIKVETYLPDDS